MEEATTGYLVLIEWDGMKPPTSYYNRLRHLTTGVRGDTSLGPITRRSQNRGDGIILQEGAIYCSELSLAKTISMLASGYGAPFVQISRMEVVSSKASKEDIEAMARIQEVLGHRGHPFEEKKWTITCLSEAKAYEQRSRGPINCPMCKATAIRVREGRLAKFRYPNASSAFEAWSRLRFFNGSYEVSGYAYHNAKEPPVDFEITHGVDAQIYKIMADSDLSGLDFLSYMDAFAIMDGIFTSRITQDKEFRQNERVKAIAFLLMNYPDVGGVRMAERTDGVDIFDAAAKYNPQYIAAWFTQIRNAKRSK